jgi:hypothetical protein
MKLPSVSQNLIQNWPTKVVFAGREIGDRIRTGKALYNSAKAKPSPVRDIYFQCMNYSPIDREGHESWDQVAVLAAMMPELNYFTFQPGRIILNEDASNAWYPTGMGHYYLKLNPKVDIKIITNTIESWMNKDAEGK